MSDELRVPALREASQDGATEWFGLLADRGLIFHPEEDPASILRIDDDSAFFTLPECDLIREVFAQLRRAIGDDEVIEAAYRPFMDAAGQTA